ncbi:MAG: ribosome biogenesis GTPase Der [Candidatus Methylomirabilales bacterium]
MSKPIIAILGRPNVGKSTLFNRLVGERKAIVHEEPGATRDRIYGTVSWRGRQFTFVDTGGFEPRAEEGIAAAVKHQAELALKEASLILFLVDAREGLTPDDEEIAKLLRQEAMKPVFLVVNKVDRPKQELLTSEFYRLGFEEVLTISAEHGLGIGELMDLIASSLPLGEEEEERAVTVAVIGRPNVGKSSLVNRILGEERVIIDEAPGTTRDAVDTLFVYESKRYLLIDTAGIRAKGKIDRDLERYSVLRALRSVKRADVALIILDAQEGVTAQDAKIGGIAHEAGCGVILVVNKWDLVDGDTNRFAQAMRERLRYLDYAPIAFVSAKTGLRVMELLKVVDLVQKEREKRIPTSELNELLKAAVEKYPPPPHRGRPVRIRFVTQVKGSPPTFVFFVNDKEGIPFSYERYLMNRLRQAYGFQGTPLKLIFRERR